jgi:glycosyltransferase involved in cell wall biosynthesis
MGAYNHAPFVGAAIESVLNQTKPDFEFLIADDGSADATPNAISAYDDPRIKFTSHLRNRGACVVLNELISRARGKYVAIINSDDVWPSHKLAYQLEFLEHHENCAAIFGRVAFIDRSGQRIPKKELSFGSVFDQPNRSSSLWLRRFFEEGNCLCHPTVLIRRSCYDAVGLYDNRFRQLPDFDMWIRIVKRFNIHVSQDALIEFRILPGENASSPIQPNSVRDINESFLIAHRFFEGVSANQLREGFADLLTNAQVNGEEQAEIEKALILLSARNALSPRYQLVGLSKLYGLLGIEGYRDILAQIYSIDDRWFQSRMSQIDTLMPDTELHQSLTQMHRRLAETDQKLAEAQQKLDAVLNSASWRLTRPYRRLVNVAAKLRFRGACK